MPQISAEFFKISPEMICIANLNGEFIEVNPAWTKVLGWELSEILHRSFIEFVHPDDLEMTIRETKDIHNIPEKITSGFENRYRHKDGSYRWLQWSASLLKEAGQVICIARDITQNKRDSVLLTETELVSKVGSWELDLTNNDLFWSKMCHQLHETDYETYSPTLEKGKKFFTPEAQKIMEAHYQDLITKGIGYDFELPFVTYKGRKTWVRCIARASMRDGIVLRVFGTLEDVGAKRREKSKNELIIESGNYGTWDWDLETNAVYFNDRFCSMIGLDYTTVEHTLQTWDRLTHPEDKIQAYKDIEDYLTGKNPIYRNVHRMKHANGKWVWILDQGKIVEMRDGKPVRFSGTHTDITYLKELEEAQDEMLTRFKLIHASNKLGVWGYDMLKKELYWDDNMYELFAMDKNIYPDPQKRWQEIIHPDDRDKTIHEFFYALKNSVDFEMEYRVFVNNGKEIRYISTKGYVERDSHGKGQKISGINWDITKKMEQQELIKEQQAKIISTAKLSSLGEMASGIAHEINNPLAIIKGKAYHILKQLEKGGYDLENLKKEITKIEQTSQRIVKIIKGLRTFSRHGDKDPFQEIEFRSVLNDVMELCNERFKHQGVEIKMSGDLDTIISCQETQMAQVLLNLINNAYDAVVDMDEPWVEINVVHDNNSVSIKVNDSGLGIDNDIADKIMQPFFTTKEVGVGTGLGLSISKGIIEMHGGRFYLDQNSRNTSFVIELPYSIENH